MVQICRLNLCLLDFKARLLSCIISKNCRRLRVSSVAFADQRLFKLSKFKVKSLVILQNAKVAQATPVLELTAGLVRSLKVWGDVLLAGLRITAIATLKTVW